MRFSCSALFVLFGFLAIGCSDHEPDGTAPQSLVSTTEQNLRDSIPQGSGFDFYVLALSWSPSYCAAEGRDANRRQCGKNGPSGFVVHGLWPQYKKGYPAKCKSSEPDRVPQQLLSSVRDLFPTDGLAAHEWRKHGTCSGLSQEEYYQVTRMARSRISIPPTPGGGNVSPPEIENAFIARNRGLDADKIAVACDGRYMREVRVCMTKDLAFISCPEVDKAGCRKSRLQMPLK